MSLPGLVDIGDMISCDPNFREGRPHIAGTRISVGRIAVLSNQGLSAEEIAEDMYGLNLAQVHAALAYYLRNKDVIDADLAAQDEETERIAEEHYRRLAERE